MTIIFDGTNGITSPGGDTANTSYTTPILKSPSSLTLQTNGSTTAMTIDTSQNVGIGTTSPSSGRLVIAQNNAVQPAISLPTDESTIQGPSANTQIRMGGNLVLGAAGQAAILTAGSQRLVVDSSGRVTMPSQPAVEVWKSSNQSSTGTIVYDQVGINRGNCYNVSNGRFTAPVTGMYLVISEMFWSASANPVRNRQDQFVNGGSRNEGKYLQSDTVDYTKQTLARVHYLNVNDFVEINAVTVSSSSLGGRPFTNLSIAFLG